MKKFQNSVVQKQLIQLSSLSCSSDQTCTNVKTTRRLQKAAKNTCFPGKPSAETRRLVKVIRNELQTTQLKSRKVFEIYPADCPKIATIDRHNPDWDQKMSLTWLLFVENERNWLTTRTSEHKNTIIQNSRNQRKLLKNKQFLIAHSIDNPPPPSNEVVLITFWRTSTSGNQFNP